MKKTTYEIFDYKNEYIILKNVFYFGFHWSSEILTEALSFDYCIFGSYELAQERIKEILGKTKKKRLKLCKNLVL